jgi:ABC-2 type transport system permease protein
MSVAWLIARHDLKRMLVQPWSWALLAATLALLAYFFLLSLDGFLALSPKFAGLNDAPGVTDLIAVPLLRTLGNLFLLIVPLLTMRAIAGERRQHALSLLLGAGIGNASIVVGKWLAVWLYAALLIGLVACMPVALGFGTTLDYGKLAGAVIGLLAETAMLAAIGVFASSWTEQPAFAAALALVLNLLFSVVDAGARFQGIGNSGINYLALPTHLDPLFRGIVSSIDLGYFALIVVAALALAARRVDALRDVA